MILKALSNGVWASLHRFWGSTQIELEWTVVPVLIVLVLFLATARILFAIQDAPKPASALDVTVVGDQCLWEFRYPTLGIVSRLIEKAAAGAIRCGQHEPGADGHALRHGVSRYAHRHLAKEHAIVAVEVQSDNKLKVGHS
jgi:heme/copper-type cytochrome/quinol oxidase subunit 2